MKTNPVYVQRTTALERVCGFITIFFILALTGFSTAGWVTNIYRLALLDANSNVGLTIVRGVGIVIPPIGAVAGYFPNPKTQAPATPKGALLP